MKFKTTKKEIMENYGTVVKVGYCDLQTLLGFLSPMAYTANNNGWQANIYAIGGRAIVTGYGVFGNVSANYELCKQYEAKARKIRDHKVWKWDTKKRKAQELLAEFIEAAKAGKA